MPAYVIRILLMMSVITLSCFAYEKNYSSKAVAISGTIATITNLAKGKRIAVLLNSEGQAKGMMHFTVGPIFDRIGQYKVGDIILIKYCSECYPIARIGDVPNMYPITFILCLLSSLIFIALIMVWLKNKSLLSRD